MGKRHLSGPLLTVVCATVLSGCLTTTKMPDGSTQVRFSDDTAKSIVSAVPAGLRPSLSGSAATAGSTNGNLDLIAVANPLSGDMMYLNGRFSFECTAALLYSAKSGAPLGKNIDDSCRITDLIDQSRRRRSGLPYDHSAPAMTDPESVQLAYWASIRQQTIAQLAPMRQFHTRIGGFPRVSKTGPITMKLGFLGEVTGTYAVMYTVPRLTPLVIPDKSYERRLRASDGGGGVGEATACDAILTFDKAVDKGPPAQPDGKYSRYEVLFTVASLACQSAFGPFSVAAPGVSR